MSPQNALRSGVNWAADNTANILGKIFTPHALHEVDAYYAGQGARSWSWYRRNVSATLGTAPRAGWLPVATLLRRRSGQAKLMMRCRTQPIVGVYTCGGASVYIVEQRGYWVERPNFQVRQTQCRMCAAAAKLVRLRTSSFCRQLT